MRWPKGLSSLRLFTLWAAVVICGLLGVGFTLFFFTQQRYFAQRNFRILADIGARVDESVDGVARIVRSARARPDTGAFDGPGSAPTWLTDSLPFVPLLTRVVPGPRGLPTASIPVNAPFSVALNGQASDLKLELRFAANDEVIFDATDFLTQLLKQDRYEDAFDAIVLATSTGQVLAATENENDRLRVYELSALIAPPATGSAEALFARGAQSTNLLEVTVNGRFYRLFLQPCCRSLRTDHTLGRRGDAPPEVRHLPTGLILAGLVSTERMRSDSMAISFSIVVAVGAILLLTVIGSPFLKLLMMRDTDRVTTSHVLLLSVSCIGGLCLTTLILLDWHAYTRLNQVIDRQLETLAAQVSVQVQDELAAAQAQLACLADQTVNQRALPSMPVANALQKMPCRPNPYPNFEIFALVDAVGMQRYKLGTERWVAASVSVADRPYFKETLDGAVWHVPGATGAPATARERSASGPPPGATLAPGIYIESIESRTTGSLRAVIAARTTNPALPVAMLTVPLVSAIKPLIVSGFAFAIVDNGGRVLFHSDSERNLKEQFFVETDSNRRLRAVTLARQSRALGLRYWGRPHRAYVAPLAEGVPWSIVTLYEKRSSWALQEEWVVVSLGFLTLYMVGLLVLLVALLAGHRAKHASWVWPQAAKRNTYRVLAVLQIAVLVASAWAIREYSGWTLATMGLAIPPVVCLAMFFLLQRSQERSASLASVVPIYTLVGVLSMLLLGVMPTVAFFKAAHDIHADNFVKHRQLRLAEALSMRQRAERSRNGEQARAGIYYSFFFDTHVTRGSADAASGVAAVDGCTLHRVTNGHAPDPVPSFIEDLLPYQSEASVEMRELSHDRTEQDAWHWRRGAKGSSPCLSLRYGRSAVTHVASNPLHLFPTNPFAASGSAAAATSILNAAAARTIATADARRESDIRTAGMWLEAQLGLVGAVLIAACYGMVTFLSRRVFLVGLERAQWGFRPDFKAGGESMVIVGSGLVPAEVDCYAVDIANIVGANGCAPERWAEELAKIDGTDASHIAIANIDLRIYDPQLAEQKLTFIEQVMIRQNRPVILTTRRSTRDIVEATPKLREKWEALFVSFIVAEAGTPGATVTAHPPHVSESRWTRFRSWLRQLPGAVEAPNRQRIWEELRKELGEVPLTRTQRQLRRLNRLLTSEGNGDSVLFRICANIRRELEPAAGSADFPSTDDVIEQIGRRAAAHYRRIWLGCSADERLVLAHIAEDGLVNAKSRAIIRNLIAKGLVRRCPDLRLMTASFERFVLSGPQRAECVVYESQRQASAWDKFQWPFATIMAAGVLFFVATQRELFDSTIASLGALATTVPALIKAAGLSRDGAATVAARAAASPGQTT
jgi:hypothetical protein